MILDDSDLKHLREEFNENTNRTYILICVPTHCTMQCDDHNSKEHKLIRSTNVLKWRGKYLDPELHNLRRSSSIVRIVKSKRLRRVGYVV
jgi:hypothetical protein